MTADYTALERTAIAMSLHPLAASSFTVTWVNRHGSYSTAYTDTLTTTEPAYRMAVARDGRLVARERVSNENETTMERSA